MIVIPDLFGSYQKGREEAINQNWNDLANYEKIEAARTANDRANLALLGEMQDWGVYRNVVNNTGTVSQLATDAAVLAQPGNLAKIEGNNYNNFAQRDVLKTAYDNDALGGMYQNKFDTSYNNSQAGLAISQTNATDAGINNNVFQTLAPETQASRLATGKANISVDNYNASNALPNAVNRQALATSNTQTALSNNNLTQTNNAYSANVTTGKMPYAGEIGAASGKLQLGTLNNGITTLANNEQVTAESNRMAKIQAINSLFAQKGRYAQILSDPNITAEQKKQATEAIATLDKQIANLQANGYGDYVAAQGTPQATAQQHVAPVSHVGEVITMQSGNKYQVVRTADGREVLQSVAAQPKQAIVPVSHVGEVITMESGNKYQVVRTADGREVLQPIAVSQQAVPQQVPQTTATYAQNPTIISNILGTVPGIATGVQPTQVPPVTQNVWTGVPIPKVSWK